MLGVRIKHLARAPDVAGSLALLGAFPALEAFSAFALFEVILLFSMITTIVASVNYQTYVTGCINHICEFWS